MDYTNESYRRTYAAVNLDTIKSNLLELKSRLKKGVLALATVKADAYGHGAVGVAVHIQDSVDYFGIAELGEALELREAGVTKPILVLSYTSPYQYERLILNDLTQTIFNYEDAVALSKAAVSLNKIARVHVAVDTGMSRIGFLAVKENVETIKRINDLPNIYIEGLFSHFACADGPDENDKTVTDTQLKVFKDFIAELEKNGMHIPIKHICNSAGLLTGIEQFEMVRLGIVLYGLYPDECVNDGSLNIKSAMRITSHVTHIKYVPEGCGVGYGHTYRTGKRTRIATVCIGYADGYPRALSNRGRVIINGHYAPVIGRVCMDQLMVDVTELPSVKVGDEVTVLGEDGGCVITPEEIASLCGTVNYEIICGFRKRVSIIHYINGIQQCGGLANSQINIRDPFVLRHGGKYYMYGTRALNFGRKTHGFDVYIGTDLENWSQPVEVLDSEAAGLDGDVNWAPEVHYYNGRFYMFATFTKKNGLRGTYILVSDSPEGQFVPLTGEAITPYDWECLDGTLYIEDGTPYCVFCHEHTQILNGTVCACELTPDLKAAKGEVFELFDAGSYLNRKATEGCHNVTDGPFLHKNRSGALCLIWSTISDSYKQCVAVSDNGSIRGSFRHEAPIFGDDGGHGMLFEAFDGSLMLALHSPNKSGFERPVFFKIRETETSLEIDK